MDRLADVNLLVALCHPTHVHRTRAAAWYAALPAGDTVLTCSITELGVLRALLNVRAVADRPAAQTALATLKASGRFRLVADDVGADNLPPYVKTAGQTTDGHLLALALRHRAAFATLDTAVPGAERV